MLNFYIDTALREKAEPLLQSGQVMGLTTNPTILERGGQTLTDLPNIYDWATAAGAREVFFQTYGSTSAELVENGRRLHDIGELSVIKVAANTAGFEATAALRELGIPVLVTAVYNAVQATLATSLDAEYIAPYFGRMNDQGRPALNEILRMQRVITASASQTKLLVASLRSPQDIVSLSEQGVTHYAIPVPVFENIYTEPLTDGAIADFDAAITRLS